MLRRVYTVVMFSLLPCSVAVAQDTAAADSVEGIYAAEQAKRGEKLFRQDCGACHASAEFKGAFFMNRWGAGTVYQLFDFLRTQMPIDNPGKLTPEEYVAVIAYLFELNGLPEGETALPTDVEALRVLPIKPSTKPEP